MRDYRSVGKVYGLFFCEIFGFADMRIEVCHLTIIGINLLIKLFPI